MCLWGVLGILCARFALPLFERKLAPLLARIPNAVNVACMALMALNVALTLVAFNCWYHRLAGEAPETPVQMIFAEHADDAYMADRFEVMSLYPQDAHRSPGEG